MPPWPAIGIDGMRLRRRQKAAPDVTLPALDAARRRTAIPIGPVLALIVATVSVQYGATLAKDLFPVVGAHGATALRLTVGALILGAICRPWRCRVPRRVAPALIGYGAALGAMNLLFYMALDRIPLGVAAAVEFSGPLLVAVLASRRRIDFVWIGLAGAGLLLLSPRLGSHPAVDPLGLLMALGAGACWALYIVFGRQAGTVLGSHTTALGTAIAALLVLPIGAVQASAALGRPMVLLSALAVGVFSSALPFSLEMVALTRMPVAVFGTLTSMEPAIGALLGLLILHQTLSGQEWVGIGVIVAAAAGAAAGVKPPTTGPE